MWRLACHLWRGYFRLSNPQSSLLRDAPASLEVQARRAHTGAEFIDIADRRLRRLNNKANRLVLAGKHPNKVKVACARKMVGFVADALHP